MLSKRTLNVITVDPSFNICQFKIVPLLTLNFSDLKSQCSIFPNLVFKYTDSQRNYKWGFHCTHKMYKDVSYLRFMQISVE